MTAKQLTNWFQCLSLAILAGLALVACDGGGTPTAAGLTSDHSREAAGSNGDEEKLPLASLRIGNTPFEIARPAIWEEGFIEGESVLESWIHPQVELYPNLNILLQKPPAPGEEGAEKMLENLAGDLPGFKLEEAAWQTINGVTGLRSISTWPSVYGDLTALRMMIPWQGKVIVISFVDFTPSFRNNAHAYNRCIDALALFKPLDIGDSR